METHLVVVYDSINNSVFQGQVLAPLIKKLEAPDIRALLVSFERSPAQARTIAREISRKYPHITIAILRAVPFLGSLSLYYASYQLKTHMRNYAKPSTITARGPLAGWIVGHTAMLDHIPCIVQARGLAAEEYRYTHVHSANPLTWHHRIRARHYETIERWAYGTYTHQKHVSIHAVSGALKQYLINSFGAAPEKISVARNDIPPAINPHQQHTWRNAIRSSLNIPPHAFVYVYNGSAKAWQCPLETITFFQHMYQNDSHSFLLVLTEDIATFTELLAHTTIPVSAYKIIHVPYTQIYQYLSAADSGIIFRENHIINWVSRPTKVLEYQAVGLKIIHNNTIALLAQQNASSNQHQI